jgi:hypothetical protein
VIFTFTLPNISFLVLLNRALPLTLFSFIGRESLVSGSSGGLSSFMKMIQFKKASGALSPHQPGQSGKVAPKVLYSLLLLLLLPLLPTLFLGHGRCYRRLPSSLTAHMGRSCPQRPVGTFCRSANKH